MSAGRRIAMISEHASPLASLGGVDAGGQNVYVGQLARHLAMLGIEVDVFTRRDDPAQPDIVEWCEGVRVMHVDAGPPCPLPKEELLPHMPAFADEMSARWERGRAYELIHANFWMSGLVAATLQERFGVPFVVTFHALGKVRRAHQGDADRFPDERFAIEERIVRTATHIVAECPQDEHDLITLYDADPARIDVIPAGFDPSELTPVGRAVARRALGLPARDRIVAHVGRMVPRKGVDDAIRGFARFAARSDASASMVVAGGSGRAQGGPDRETRRLMQVAHEEGVRDAVRFLGHVERPMLRTVYSAADAFVTTPWYEPFGITPLEAMACGTPVVGSNVGGIRFTVRDGETGFLVPPRDPDAIAARLQELFENPALMAALRRQAIRRVHDLFTWRHVASQIAVLYDRVLAGSHLVRLVDGRTYAVPDAVLGRAAS
jgi:D-inositol-3-phosphate glycosyltransferase